MLTGEVEFIHNLSFLTYQGSNLRGGYYVRNCKFHIVVKIKRGLK